MNLPRRSFYHQRKEKAPDKVLEARIGDICLEFSGYGYRRVTKQLHREGWTVNHKKVSRIMREKGLQCRPRKRWVRTTDSNHGFRIYPNLVRDINISAINQVWVADITYIHILVCFVYLAGHSGRLFEKGYRLCPIKEHRYQPDPGCSAHGHKQQATGTGLYPSFRPGHSVCISWLCKRARVLWFSDQHEPQRKSL